jgi:hypothetical protein
VTITSAPVIATFPSTAYSGTTVQTAALIIPKNSLATAVSGGGAYTLEIITQGSKGVASINTNGDLVYTPNATPVLSAAATDSFTYRVKNSASISSTNSATASVAITPAPALAPSPSGSAEGGYESI